MSDCTACFLEALPKENEWSLSDAVTVCGTGGGSLWGAVRHFQSCQMYAYLHPQHAYLWFTTSKYFTY